MNPNCLRHWLAFLLLGVSALGQGTVNLNNNFTPQGSPTKAFVLGMDNQPLAKAVGRVEVLDANGMVLKSGGFALPGIFALGVVEIPGALPGGTGIISLRFWDSSSGSSYDNAMYRTQVQVRLSTLGGGTLPPPPLQVAGDFTGAWLATPIAISALITEFIPSENSVRIRAIGTLNQQWTLWTTGNWISWNPAGASQQPVYDPLIGSSMGSMEWMVPSSGDIAFFKVESAP
jgi:hypothetical protein